MNQRQVTADKTSHKRSATENVRISDPSKFTPLSLYQAGTYWPILMQIAKDNQGRRIEDFSLIQYLELIKFAKVARPDDPQVKNAIPVSIGKALDPINWFCREHDLPNLSCLVVDAKGKPGEGYMRNNNWQVEKAAVAAYDWQDCDVLFNSVLAEQMKAAVERNEVKAAKAASAKPQRLTDAVARKLLSDHWYANPGKYTKITNYEREDMINLIRDHMPVEEAIKIVLDRRT